MSNTPWRRCGQAIHFHRVISTQVQHIFWAPPFELLYISQGSSGLGLGSSPIGHVHAQFLQGLCLLPERFSMHLFNLSMFVAYLHERYQPGLSVMHHVSSHLTG
jgi:hypothetical protein